MRKREKGKWEKVLAVALFSIFYFPFSSPIWAQAWSGIIAPSRAIDWSKAGLPPTLPDGETTPNRYTPPTRQTLCATIAPEGTASSPADPNTNLNPALAACAAANPSGGGYVLLSCGSPPCNYHYSGHNIRLGDQNNVTLRMGGADKVFVYLHGSSEITFEATSLCSVSNSAWSAGYARGATSITVANNGCLTAGQSIIDLWQCVSGYSGSGCSTANAPPASGTLMDNGGLWDCNSNLNYCANQGTTLGGNTQLQVVLVTSVSGSGPYTFTISPGLYLPNWTASQSPFASWVKNSVGMGVEDGTIDCLGSTTQSCIYLAYTYGSWVKGVRALGGSNQTIQASDAKNYLISNSYVYTQPVTGTGALPLGIEEDTACDGLILNNIVQIGPADEIDGSACGTVFAYNYARDGFSNSYTQTFIGNDLFDHVAGIDYELREGNELAFIQDDNIHGSRFLNTSFRNLLFANDPPYTKSSGPIVGLSAEGYSRFDNWIGNVLGSGTTTNYQGVPGNCLNNAIYFLGCRPGTAFPIDEYAVGTTMRWGNYDVVNNAVRFVNGEVPSSLDSAVGLQMALTGSGAGPYTGTIPGGNLPCIYGNNVVINGAVFGYDLSVNGTITGAGISSGSVNCTTGAVTVTFSNSTTSAVYLNYLQQTTVASSFQNFVPTGHALPNSFFLAAVSATNGGTGLSWWKTCTNYTTGAGCGGANMTPPFPPHGPDVGSGNETNGFGNDIPAAIAWRNLPVDSNYQASYSFTSSSWSSGTETLSGLSLPGGHSIVGEFQIPTGPCAGTYLITGSTGSSVSYAVPSNPGCGSSGSILYPDVRVFNEAVFQTDPAAMHVPPLNLSISAH